MSGRIQKTSGIVAGLCGLTLWFKQWHNGQNLKCEEVETGITSYPRRPLSDAVDLFCHNCRNNPQVIRRKSEGTSP